MNWFKFAKDFSDRNVINSKIRYLKNTKETLKVLSKLVFQSGKNTKNTTYKIVSSAKITSYPLLHKILMDADELVLDSPWRFAKLCKEANKKIDSLIYSLKKERDEITFGGIRKKVTKGLV